MSRPQLVEYLSDLLWKGFAGLAASSGVDAPGDSSAGLTREMTQFLEDYLCDGHFGLDLR